MAEKDDPLPPEIPEEAWKRIRQVIRRSDLDEGKARKIEEAIPELYKNYPVAGANFVRWVLGEGGTKYFRPAWLKGFQEVRDAEDRIRGYFKSITPAKKVQAMENRGVLKDGARVALQDWFDGNILPSSADSKALYYASYRSSILAQGYFWLEVTQHDQNWKLVSVEGYVVYKWYDPYHFTIGKGAPIPGIGWVSDADIRKLKDVGAKDYMMESYWYQIVTGRVWIYRNGTVRPAQTRLDWGKVQYNPDGRQIANFGTAGRSGK